MEHESNWISVADRLPLSGPDDDAFSGGFFETEVDVLARGEETQSTFWACWEERIPGSPDYDSPEVFVREFDVDGVTHWRPRTHP